MAIDRFERWRFESVLPKHKQTNQALWTHMGLVHGEHTYEMKAGKFAKIVIRSSIGQDDLAKESGQDSIRLYLEIDDDGKWRSVKKLDAWTQRTHGWEERMTEKLRTLWTHGAKVKRSAGECGECGHEKRIVWFVKNKGPNNGRPMVKCPKCGDIEFLDETQKEAKKKESEAPQSLDSILEAIQKTVVEEAAEIVDSEWKLTEKQPDPQQLAAINAPLDKPARMISGAGSGKTFTLERRYKHLIANGVDPSGVVVVTFSKTQSQDMLERIALLNPEIRGTSAENWICTIHAFCLRTLKMYQKDRKIPSKGYEIKRALQDISRDLWPFTDEADPATCRPSWEEILSAHGNAKYRMIRDGFDKDFYTDMWGSYHGERLATARSRFDSFMKANNWWTFTDMLYDMELNLIDDKNFREEVQQRFQYVMLDEAQDTNEQAMRILQTVAAPQNRVFFVGDPDQLLFRFTGATPEANLYEGFSERYPDGETYFLETNYRSTGRIVERSNGLIKQNYERNGGPYPDEFAKTLNSRGDAPEGVDINWNFYGDPESEADGVVDTILELIQDGMHPSEIFVSSRTRAQLGYLEAPLTAAGVPFINITGGSFWLLRHVQVLLSYIKLANDGTDEDALRRVYNVASENMRDRSGEYCGTRYLGNAFLQRIDGIYDKDAIEDAVAYRRSWYYGAKDLTDMMDEIDEAFHNDGYIAAMRAVMVHYEKYLRYEEGLKEGEEDIGKLHDLRTVIEIARKCKDWDDFLEKVESAIKAAEDAKNKNWDEYVVLSTVHRLKGLEREVMFGVGWCETEDDEERLKTEPGFRPAGLLPHTYSKGVSPPQGVLSFGNTSRLEDERCIAYVCVTRAKQSVYLSGFADGYVTYGRSRFATEIMAEKEQEEWEQA
jgi:DNA helicase-2/ATP-dependent DNA helicase PcrA